MTFTWVHSDTLYDQTQKSCQTCTAEKLFSPGIILQNNFIWTLTSVCKIFSALVMQAVIWSYLHKRCIFFKLWYLCPSVPLKAFFYYKSVSWKSGLVLHMLLLVLFNQPPMSCLRTLRSSRAVNHTATLWSSGNFTRIFDRLYKRHIELFIFQSHSDKKCIIIY